MNSRFFIIMRPKAPYQGLFILLCVLFLTGCDPKNQLSSTTQPPFELEVLDEAGPRAPWGKALGDIDGDGLLDVIVGGHQPRHLTLTERLLRKVGLFERSGLGGELVWYRNPTWERHLITEDYKVRTDIEVADINDDGRNDIVMVTDRGVVWLDGRDWSPHRISPLLLHDIEIVDLDREGHLDIVGRNQSLFGHHDGHLVHILRQDAEHHFSHLHIVAPHGEGLAVADMNGDGFQDIVVNQQWFRNPERLDRKTEWVSTDYDGDWSWDDVYIDVADINQDGRPDILLSPAEQAGQYYRLSWFEAPSAPGDRWREHVVDPRVEAVHHFVEARDIDRNGQLEILTAEMNQGENDNPVSLYRQTREGWVKERISNLSSHNMHVADIDNDFDLDLMGTNWQIENNQVADYPVYLWRNRATFATVSWKRHLIDEQRPGQATFIFAADLDGDSATDLATGGYWYRQPDTLAGNWHRSSIGDRAANAALLEDFDRDGDVDVLASSWRGYNHRPSLLTRVLNRLGIRDYDYGQSGEQFVWAENDGRGYFDIHDNIEPAQGDFLQGADQLADVSGEAEVVLSWHREGEGLQALTIPDDPQSKTWRWRRLTGFSQDEAVSVVDLDRDGRMEIVTGTAWLSQEGVDWIKYWITDSRERPDRHRIADINRNGRLDVIVGFEAVSRPGKLAWFEQPLDPHDNWIEHLLPTLVGPMSLGIGDIDLDGDIDIVVGEHNLDQPALARLAWLENRSGRGGNWRPHLIHQGDEHHDGALVIDLDGDGDLDIASIGWGHGKVLVYENLTR